LWIVADSDRSRCPRANVADSEGIQLRQKPLTRIDGLRHQSEGALSGQSEVLADPNEGRRDGGPGDQRQTRGRELANGSGWPVEPDVGRVAHGVAHRVDRLAALGDGQVPRVFARAWELLTDGIE
jgi:DNA (cytosine-5)-methyltransferase 1